MAPKRSHDNLSRASHELNRAEEWVSSVSNEATLNQLVGDGVLPDRVMAGWRPARGESFPTPPAVMNWSCLKIISIVDLAFRSIRSSID